MSDFVVLPGDCVEVMRTFDADSVDAIVTDPPYGLEFMGKEWDKLDVRKATRGTLTNMVNASGKPKFKTCAPAFDLSSASSRAMQEWHHAWAVEALRVAKPGAHLLAFGGTRTSHRLACALEDAGWELRDTIMWVYGSGYPKSRYVLKPAYEPILIARKPLVGTVAANVRAHGTGAINIDRCRVEYADDADKKGAFPGGATTSHGAGSLAGPGAAQATKRTAFVAERPAGRWPANLIHDGSEEVVALFPGEAGAAAPASGPTLRNGNASNSRNRYNGLPPDRDAAFHGDAGSAARFFYCAKASKSDREAGNNHPTVKPTALMRYLVRLVTPLGGLVLDPFCGSGSTGKAALLEGFRFVGVEQDAAYRAIAEARLLRTM